MEIKVKYQGNLIDAMEEIKERVKKIGYDSITIKQDGDKLVITINAETEVSPDQLQEVLAAIKNLSCVKKIL